MATLLNFTNLEVHSRTIRLTCFDYDVIVVCDFDNFRRFEILNDRVI